MHKTGSSTLQRFLSRNRIGLRALGVYYPPSTGADGRRQPKHNALFTAISHEADFGVGHPVLGPSAALVEDLARRIEQSRARIAIVSAEGFSGERPVFARAFAPLATRFDVRIVVFLRRQDFWVESFYKQMVLSREVREARSFKDFLSAPSTRAHLDYPAILGWWADAFDTRAIRIVPFEPALRGEGPVRMFLHAAGLPSTLSWLTYSRGHLNRGPSAEMTEVIRFANERGTEIKRGSIPKVERLIHESSPYFFTRAERETMLEAYSEACGSLVSTYDCGISGPLFAQRGWGNDCRVTSWLEHERRIESALFLPFLL